MALAEDQKVAKSVARELRADEAEHDAAVVETGGVVKWRDPQIRGIFLKTSKRMSEFSGSVEIFLSFLTWKVW